MSCAKTAEEIEHHRNTTQRRVHSPCYKARVKSNYYNVKEHVDVSFCFYNSLFIQCNNNVD